jgi:hypothetical protein
MQDDMSIISVTREALQAAELLPELDQAPLALATSNMFMIVSFNFLLCDTNKPLLRAWGPFGQTMEC